MKFGTVKSHGHTYKFYLTKIYFDEVLNMGLVQNFEITLALTMNHFV